MQEKVRSFRIQEADCTNNLEIWVRRCYWINVFDRDEILGAEKGGCARRNG